MQHRAIMNLALAATAAMALIAAALAQAPQLPSPTATIALPSAGPADPKLRALNLPGGKKMHLLPATLETTQWGWFDNAQPPVLRINSGDSVALETMMQTLDRVESAQAAAEKAAPAGPAAPNSGD